MTKHAEIFGRFAAACEDLATFLETTIARAGLGKKAREGAALCRATAKLARDVAESVTNTPQMH